MGIVYDFILCHLHIIVNQYLRSVTNDETPLFKEMRKYKSVIGLGV